MRLGARNARPARNAGCPADEAGLPAGVADAPAPLLDLTNPAPHEASRKPGRDDFRRRTFFLPAGTGPVDLDWALAFQRAPQLEPPHWPDPESPQRLHLGSRVPASGRGIPQAGGRTR